MFKLIAKCITKYKQERANRNALCKELWNRIDYTLNQEKALFLGRTGEVDPGAIEKWQALVAGTIDTLGEVQFDKFWNIRRYFALKRCLSYLIDYSNSLDQRVAAHNQRVCDNRICNQLISQAEAAYTRYSSMFQDVTEFVDPEQCAIWAKDVRALLIRRNEVPIKRRQQTHNYDYLAHLLSMLEKWQSDVKRQVRQHNEKVYENRAKAVHSVIGKVEGRQLDEQQLNCISKKAHNHLVLAGAGTGKTTTVVGKIKYLLKSGQCRPEDILVLSFTKASADEMNGRIRAETGVSIQACTFHKLGINIIAAVQGTRPKVSQLNLRQFIREQLEMNMRSEEYLARLAIYWLYSRMDENPEHDFEAQVSTEILRQVSQDKEKILDRMAGLFETVINLMKSNRYSIEDVYRKNAANNNLRSVNDILWLITPITNAYEQYLRSQNEIDFNDMIALATEHVVQGKYSNPYRFVIVDEYQDISRARYHLLKALRESSDYDLFAVGDDWQSIYRFAGSDIGFILDFATYWGPSEESRIETTYRFSQSLINVSGDFIMKNPAQKKKAIKGQTEDYSFAFSEICAYTEKKAVSFMAERLEQLPQNSTVYFIGRYSSDCLMLKDNDLFELQYNPQSGLTDVFFQKRRDLNIQFLTAHKSKGLQADYVVLLNNKNTRMGFPSKIQDSAILELLLEKTDDYPDAEERRLFYVAMTRAKKKVILLTVQGKESVFVEELKSRYPAQFGLNSWTPKRYGRRR